MESREELFRIHPVKSAIKELVMPTVLAQLVNVFYNLADIFFVGQTGNSAQIAALSVASPLFMIMTATGNLFGIGGAAAISVSAGAGKKELAEKQTVFCIWTTVIVAALYSSILWSGKGYILCFMGVSGKTAGYAQIYFFYVMVAGSIPAILNVVLNHIIRAAGEPEKASEGLILGSLANIILDACFTMIFPWGVRGVAVATFVANVGVTMFYIGLFCRNRKKISIAASPLDYRLSGEVIRPVLLSGTPAAVQTFCVSVMYLFMNKIAAEYGDFNVAAVGVVQKIDMIPQYVTLGISQGMIPFLAFNYGAGEQKRMWDARKYALKMAIVFSVVCVGIFEVLAPFFVQLFVHEAGEIAKSAVFLRIMCISTPVMAYCNVSTALFQATGKAREALTVSLFRKGYVGIPMLFLLNWIIGEYGILWAPLVVDALAAFLLLWFKKRFAYACETNEKIKKKKEK